MGRMSITLPIFVWLDHVPWNMSPALYVGVMVLAGLCAFFVAFSPSHVIPRICVFLLYTYGWSMSMLDSYQHHYFLSLVLFCACFISGHVFGGHYPEQKHEVWPFRLVTITVALLYLFAALSKLESGWRDGRLLADMIDASNLDRLSLLQRVLGHHFWPAMSALVITGESLLAIAYMLIPWLSRPMRWMALMLGVCVHLGIEFSGLHIGWFSYYMILLAIMVFVPSSWVSRAERLRLSAWDSQLRPSGFHVLGFLAAVSIAAYVVDLPGARIALATYSVMLAGVFLYGALTGRSETLREISNAGLGSVLVLVLAIGISDVRFDYYRYAGKDAERKGELQVALRAYTKAEQYAPRGKSRAHKIGRLRQALSARRSR